MKSKSKLLLSAIGICVIAVVVFFLLPEKIQKSVRWRIKKQYLILTGGLVSIGDYRLRIECQGTGNPTVIMDSGLNMPMKTWESVPQEVAKFTRVCVYERAGIGESDSSSKDLRTSKDVVADLQKLLRNSGEKTPFVLVGHSFGGINMRLYSSLFPKEVVGLVLVDSSHPDQYQRYADIQTGEEREKYLRHEGGANNEKIDLLASAQEVKNSSSNLSIPLIVLSAENEKPDEEEKLFMKDHNELQADLGKLSPKAKLVILKDSSHFIQKDRPDAVIEAIKNIFETTKKSQ